MTVEGGILSGQELLATDFARFLCQVIVVVALTRFLAVLLHYVGQPRVIAEVIGGIMLGPSLLGKYIPAFKNELFKASSLPYLQLVANIGLVLYLFIVGIELDPATMARNAKRTAMIAFAGIAVPFALG